MRLAKLMVCWLLLMMPYTALAADEIFLGFGGSVSIAPYRDYDTQWSPYPVIGYESNHFFIRDLRAGVKIVNTEIFELSAFGGYDSTSFDPSDSSHKRLRELSRRHSTAVAGLEARVVTPYGMFHASGARDVLGHGDGSSGVVGYMLAWEYGDWEFVPKVGVRWSDAKYNDYYYGVSRRESNKTGLKHYRAGAGVDPYVGLTIDYSILEGLEVFCTGELLYLNSEIKDSPMTGRSTTYTATIGFSYDF